MAFPANGDLSGFPPNVTYTPNPSFSGTDTFTFTVSDEVSTSGTATVTITVNNVDEDGPVANDDGYSTAVNIPLVVAAPAAAQTLYSNVNGYTIDDEGRLQRFGAIEVGRDNTYGHPTPSTLGALRSVPRVVRTDRDGTVRLRVSDGRMTLDPAGAGA